MSNQSDKIKKEEEKVDDFSHRVVEISQGLESNRIDLQIKALISINNEFEEYDNSGMKGSIMSLFGTTSKPEKKEVNKNNKVNHKVANKKELFLFLKLHAQPILDLVIKCPHEELLRHSIPIVQRINDNGLLCPNFASLLYPNAERVGGSIMLRAQDVIVTIFNSLSSTEKSKFIHSTTENSQKGNLNDLHMLCKMIVAQILPSQQIVMSFKLIVQYIQELNEEIIQIAKVSTYSMPLRRILIGEFKDKTNDPRINIVFNILSATAPFGGDSDEINKMIEQALAKEVPNLIDSIEVIGKSDDSVFKVSLAGIISLSGFNEAQRWVNKWNAKRAELAISVLEERKELPSSSSQFVKEVFTQYNVLVTKALSLEEDKEISYCKFEGLYGVNLIWELLMITGDWPLEHLIEKIYENKHLKFVRSGIEAFKRHPTQEGANSIEGILKRYSTPKTIVKSDTKNPAVRWVTVKRVIREESRLQPPNVQMKTFASWNVVSQTTKVTKMLLEDAQKEVSRTYNQVDKSERLNQRGYEATTQITKIVLDSINDLVIDEYAQESMRKSIGWINNKRYSVKVFIGGSEVPMTKNIGNYIDETGEMLIEIHPGTAGIEYEEVKKDEKKAETNNVVGGGKQPVIIKEEKKIEKCKEEDIKELIGMLENEKIRNNVIKVIRGVNKYVEWEGNAIELAIKEGPKQALGVARLENIEEGLKEEEFKDLLITFCELLVKGNNVGDMLGNILLRNEEKMSKKVFEMDGPIIEELNKQIIKELDKASMTLCLVILLRNGKVIPWDKDVLTPPVLRALKDGINKEIFESVLPLLNEPPKLVEECNRIIIEYADENCEDEHPFIQSMIQNIINFSSGLNVAIRAFRTMRKKQILLYDHFNEILDKLLPLQGRSELKDTEMSNLISLLSECVDGMNEEIRTKCFNHFNEILVGMNGCNERVNFRTEQFAGLVNQGCTCYMNSVLQQIFHSEECTRELLKENIIVPVLKEEEKEVTKKEEPKDEIKQTDEEKPKEEKEIPTENIEEGFVVSNKNEYKDYLMISGLQKLFVDMLKGISGATQTKDFCKDAHGSCYEDIKTYEQMDAQEFFNTTISSMETCKKHANVIGASKVFKGEMEISIRSQCGHVVKRNEPFCCSALEVEHCQKMEQSLQSLCDGSILCDYRCEECGKTSDAQRSEKYKALPNVLVFHLKRFGYNDQFEIVKYNGKFEYPNEIDIKKYCCEDINDGTQYKLVGIVIHSGGAHGGHYTSNRLVNGKWVCFNDRTIGDAENETWFGGKSTSAYMLFYERIKNEEKKETFVNVDIDTELDKFVQNKNNHCYVSQRATNPFLVDLICSFIRNQKQIGNLFEFISTVTVINSPGSVAKIFSTIDLILDENVAKEVLQKITPFLNVFALGASPLILKSIRLVRCEEFNKQIIELVKAGTNGSLQVLKELCDLKQVDIKDVIEITKQYLMSTKYNRNEGIYAFCIVLKGIEMNHFVFEEEFLKKLIGSKAPEVYIEQFVVQTPVELVEKVVLGVCTDALKRGFVNYDEILFVRRMVVSRNIAEKIALECKNQILLCNAIENVVKTITVALKLTSCSSMIYHELKQFVVEINEAIIDFSIKIVM